MISGVGVQAGVPLTPGEPISLPGTKGRFDFIRMDASADCLLLGHTGNKSFDLFDVVSGKLLKSIQGYEAADGGVDPNHALYYASCSDPARLLLVDATTLQVSGEVPLPANSDLMKVNPVTGLVHVCNDKAPQQWVIDPVARKIVATLPFEGSGMEDMLFSPDGKQLYQAIKGAGAVAVVNTDSNTIEASWNCGLKGPWGLAMAPEINSLLAACAGKLLLFDCASGKIVATVPIPEKVDEIAYDSALHVAYCSSRLGVISCVAVEAGKLTPLGDVPSQKGCANVAVDPKRHIVWIAYGNESASFVQPFTPSK